MISRRTSSARLKISRGTGSEAGVAASPHFRAEQRVGRDTSRIGGNIRTGSPQSAGAPDLFVFRFFPLVSVPPRAYTSDSFKSILGRNSRAPPPKPDNPLNHYDPLYKSFGLVLIGAGVLKFALSDSSESTGVLTAFPKWALPLVPLYELLLGGWLVSGWLRYGAWVASLVTLSIFALHNLALMSAGRSSCGCLGSAVDVSPGVMLAFGTVAGMLLLKRRRRWAGWPTTADNPWLRPLATTAIVTAGVLGIAAGLAYWQYGSVTAAVADLRAESLAVVPTDLEVGFADHGTVVETSVRVHNLTDEPAHLAYAKGSCACAVFPDLPLVVPPRGTADVRVLVTVSGPPGPFNRDGLFRTNVGHVRFGIRGWIPARRDPRPTDPSGSASR